MSDHIHLQSFIQSMAFERRAEEREPMVGAASIMNNGKKEAKIVFDCVTANVSHSGACFHTCHEIERGKAVVVSGKAIGSGRRKAQIVWCRRIDEDIYGIGVSFS